MAFFPVSPSDGQQATVGNILYQWSAATGAWNRVGTTVIPLVDGATVTISGNLLVSGSGVSTFSSRISAAGNVTGGNLITNGILTASGGVTTSGNITGLVLAATDRVTAYSSITGGSLVSNSTISASGTITSQNNLVALNTVQGGSLYSLGNATISADIFGGGGMSLPGLADVGNIRSGNIIASDYITTTSYISASGNITSAANVTGANIISLGNITATGNIGGSFILGNGFYLTGVQTGGGGGGGGNRANVSVNSGSIANAATANTTVTIAKGYALYKISTNVGSWVRVYTSGAARTADSSRNQFTDPQPGAGVIAEVITSGSNVVVLSPGAIGFNDENPVSNVIPLAITNLSGSTNDVTVTFTYVGIES